MGFYTLLIPMLSFQTKEKLMNTKRKKDRRMSPRSGPGQGLENDLIKGHTNTDQGQGQREGQKNMNQGQMKNLTNETKKTERKITKREMGLTGRKRVGSGRVDFRRRQTGIIKKQGRGSMKKGWNSLNSYLKIIQKLYI